MTSDHWRWDHYME